MKRTKKKSSMRADHTGGTYLNGWGNTLKRMRRLERKRRNRDAEREIKES